MNKVFIISLLALMLVQPFSKVLLLVDYQANKDYIMEFLCINREKPEMGCEGKCYLSKKLKAQEESEKQADKQSQKSEVQLNLICHSLFSLQAVYQLALQKSVTSYTSGQPVSASHPIFHPPQSIA